MCCHFTEHNKGRTTNKKYQKTRQCFTSTGDDRNKQLYEQNFSKPSQLQSKWKHFFYIKFRISESNVKVKLFYSKEI